MQIKFYDVEHGSCAHIITPKNQHFLIDIGSKVEKSISRHLKTNFLKNYGDTIDYLIITHPHQDHIEDLPNLFSLGLNPKALQRTNEAFPLVVTNRNDEKHKLIIETANKMHYNYNSSIDNAVSPTNQDFNGGVQFNFFNPNSASYNKKDLNTYSFIVVMQYVGFKFVFTGDNPPDILEKMIISADFKNTIKDATVLLAPHHGRDGEFCESFVKTVNPLLTVFSDSTIKYSTQEYSAQKYYNFTRGVKWSEEDRYVFTTRSDGTITFTLNADKSWSINTSKEEYWLIWK